MTDTATSYKNIAVFCCLNALTAILAVTACFKACGIELNVWGLLFSIAANFGHFGIIALLVFGLLALVGYCGRTVTKLVAILLCTALLSVLVLDIFVYVHYRTHLNPALLGLFLSPAGKELVTMDTAMWSVVFGMPLGIVLLEIGYVKLAPRIHFKPVLFLIAFFAVCVPAYNLIFITANFYNYAPVLSRAEAVPYLQVLTANKLLRKMGFKERDAQRVQSYTGHLKYPVVPLRLHNMRSKPNILVILIDSWRPDSLDRQTMPLLHRRSAKAVRFDQHFSGGNATRCGVFAFFYGIPASYWHSFLAVSREPVLMNVAARNGYEFAIYASANLTSPEFDRTVFSSVPNLRTASKGSTKVTRDLDAQNGFLDFLANRQEDRPFFGFMFYDALQGIEVPKNGVSPFPTDLKVMNYFSLTNDTNQEPIRNLYKNAAYNVDLMLDRVFETLERQGLMGNTIVIVSGDHSQELNDSHTNSWGHNVNFSRYETQVPLLVFWPGKTPAQYSHRTTHLDVVPTLMQRVFNCENPAADYSVGADLFDAGERPYTILASYSKTAIMIGDEVFVLDKYGLNQGWDLDYSKKADRLPPKVLKSALLEMRRFYE
ncbi:MAG: sulfatase-like hydrolase/transferase [Verrucomicrobiales bacterium]|jgi:membrane-anchored protein YejM (alkaline phosphatase superfamily)|nr:sulfatase-like hydrolase/transferase [Verrucomicrobiales bacterium]